MALKVPNQYRIRHGVMESDDSIGNCGAFEIPIMMAHFSDGLKPIALEKMPEAFASSRPIHSVLMCIADDGYHGQSINEPIWEHVSCYKYYNVKRYIPSWCDMNLIKDLFWEPEDCVIQLHPPKSEYVNNNPYVLHLWRPVGIQMPRPPKELI